MPLPRLLAQINKRVFNPGQVNKGDRPVLTHVGRSSGTVYRTPLDAFPIEGGYVFVLMYGPKSDWARNIVAAGSAQLTVDGREIELVRPRVVPRDEVWDLLPAGTKAPPGFLRVGHCLRMDLA